MTTSYTHGQIIIQKNDFLVPHWILDDIGNFYPNVYDQIILETKHDVKIDIKFLKEFLQLRKQIYYACNWYDELIDESIPTIKSNLFCIDNDYNVMKNILDSNLIGKKFLKFCNACPKDIYPLPIFENKDTNEIINIFKKSNRTNFMIDSTHKTHLMIRDVVNIKYEVRCFWHKFKLRAISGPDFFVNLEQQEYIKKMITIFFEKYGQYISYNSATIDIGLFEDDVFVIEINSYGIDGQAGAELFKWKEDFNILYNATEPIYRFMSEFHW